MEYDPSPYRTIPSERQIQPQATPPSARGSSQYILEDEFDEDIMGDFVDNHDPNQLQPYNEPASNYNYSSADFQLVPTKFQNDLYPYSAAAESDDILSNENSTFGSDQNQCPIYPHHPDLASTSSSSQNYQQRHDYQPVEFQEERISHPTPELIPVTHLPKPYLRFFGFSHFNSIQSKSFSIVYQTNHNLLANAPTGSGKTVIFELAILRMLEYNESSKAVYMAPTKSLCAERFRDWSKRFRSLGVTCVEVTGDNENSSLADAKLAHLIITTPEKWDSMTRRWFDFTKLLNKLRLVCIDEVHMLNESRGSVLEVIVARMKTLGTNIRLIAISATAPNISDVAEWLGDGGVADPTEKALTGQAPAKIFIFGEEYRPVKLSKFVYGYLRRPEHTEYQFMSLLNFKLMDQIINHSSGRPTLIFCGTRKSSLQAAEVLSKTYENIITEGKKLPWKAPKSTLEFNDKKLSELSRHGIGIHHAGLDQSDRRKIESLFLSNKISVLCTTSTLSVGVNLPARCVIIRGTKTYKGSGVSKDGFEDYSDLDLIQMMGRAGRPQFDDEGVAVVMTSQNDKMRIEKLVRSETLLESCLHLNLTEHINSEIFMGTITSRTSAIDWLENSFLAVRIKKNPKHYAIGDDQVAPEKQLAKFAGDALDLLVRDGLIEEDEEHQIRPTELGEIMSKFCLRHTTFLNLVHLKPNATLRNILEVVGVADEYSSLRLRAGEGMVFRTFNSHPELKCPLPGKITHTWQKIMLLIQAVLCGIPLTEVKSENTNPIMEVNLIWQHLPRICKCLVALAIARQDASIKVCLEFLRSITAKAWDDSPWVLRQFDQIGEKSVKRLTDSGISTIEKLQNTSTHRIEMILDRNPPFGTRIVRQARSVPKFFCKMDTISETAVSEGVHVCVQVTVGLSNTGETPVWKWKNSTLMTTVLTMTNDLQWIEFRTIQARLLSETKQFTIECILVKPSQVICTYVACNQIAGIGLCARWKPQTSREHFPKPQIISDDQAATQEVLEGLNTNDFLTSNSESDGEFRRPQSSSQVGASVQKREPSQYQWQKVPQNSQAKKRLASKRAVVNEKPYQQTRDKLENGRYKCAHRCKGTCHHQCCRDGLTKPSKVREPNGSAPSASKNPKYSGGYYKSGGSSTSNKFRKTHMTRTAEDWKNISQAKPGYTSNMKHPDFRGKIKPTRIGKILKPQKDDVFDDLPSLEKLEAMQGDQDNTTRDEASFGKIIDEGSEKKMQDGPSRSFGSTNGNFQQADGEKMEKDENFGNFSQDQPTRDNPNESTSLERFRNHKKSVEDFDERGIFYRRKEVSTSPSVQLQPKGVAERSIESDEQTNHSLPAHLSPRPKKANEDDTKSSRISQDTDEIDDLDEDWDVKIFEGYLAPESQQTDIGNNLLNFTKRSADQIEGGDKITAPKRLKEDVIQSRSTPFQSSEDENKEPEVERRAWYDDEFKTNRLTDLEYLTDLNASIQPMGSPAEVFSNGNFEGDHDNDELMAMVDEVMAWAESHVIK